MICPACNYELLTHSEHCENCGAPGYLVSALQSSEEAHCTYCGARNETGNGFCHICGLKKDFKTDEIVIGACRNCGTAWRNVWLYCQTCGFARGNGLLETTLPVPVYFPLAEPVVVGNAQLRHSVESVLSPSPAAALSESTESVRLSSEFECSDEMLTAAHAQSFLSENEVVGRMFVSDLPVTSSDGAATNTEPAENEEDVNEAMAAALEQSTLAEDMSDPTTTASEAAATSLEKSVTAPVQAVRYVDNPTRRRISRGHKRQIRILALLIALILLFSALLIFGARIQGLLRKAFAPASSTAATASQENTPKAPTGMVYIPGGVFRQGREDGDVYESPTREVTVAPFFMDRTEVTNEQYAEFVKATNHSAPLHWKDGLFPEVAAKFPVVQVSWQDANEYAAWAGKRLPTEVEWEFAARAQDDRRYPWGAVWDAAKANTSESAFNQPVAVGNYPNAANPYGLLDMAGNVWEWTTDEMVSYKDASITLAPGKVIRGGAFYRRKEQATTTFRGFAPPDKPAIGIGFRCVKDVK